jgi:hypothetical protein
MNLRWHWGAAYEIGADAAGWAGTWTARRRDMGDTLTAGDPAALRELILADYGQRPVPR